MVWNKNYYVVILPIIMVLGTASKLYSLDKKKLRDLTLFFHG